MFQYLEPGKSNWCIVEADDPQSDRLLGPGSNSVPVQYARLKAAATPMQDALHRAASVAPRPHIIVTAFEEYRHLWEPKLWSVAPERRFICDNRAASRLASAAAILSVAARSPSNVIAILPARCSVMHEWLLRRALKRAIADLPAVPEGAITLGMADLEEGIDEDYLVIGRPRTGSGFGVDGYVRRPIPWIARHLRHNGALVASGIMIGYAGVFAAHISKNWPGITRKLMQVVSTAAALGEECEIAAALNRGVSPAVLHSLRWHPPAFRQRVLSVFSCGWSGLRSQQSIGRRVEYLACEEQRDSSPMQDCASMALQTDSALAVNQP